VASGWKKPCSEKLSKAKDDYYSINIEEEKMKI